MTTTLAARVVAGLKDKILAGDLPAGHKLPSEAELIAEFGVSRTVVREAVTRLRAEGLVETFHGRGSFVLTVPEPTSFTVESAAVRTHQDVLDMIDFRVGIETEAAALAAARVDDAGGAAIRTALEAFSRNATRRQSRPTSDSIGRSRPPAATASTSTCSTHSVR